MKLLLEDNFAVDGLLDPNLWGYERGCVRNNERQYYTEALLRNARVNNGAMVLETHLEPDGSITSASVFTKMAFQYGRVEVIARLPGGRGVWPAIWMLPEEWPEGDDWPHCGEIDIMEFVGHDPAKVHASVHTTRFNHMKGNTPMRHTNIRQPGVEHPYTLDWNAKRLEMALDRNVYFVYPHEAGRDWPFDRKFRLKINLAIGGTWGGAKGVDEKMFPQRLQIESVRIYQG